MYKKHPKKNYNVWLTEADINELKRLETALVLERNQEIKCRTQKEIDDIWDYYTFDSEEDKIMIKSYTTENSRPMRVKGMYRKSESVEKKLKEKGTLTVEELRVLEGW